MGAAACRAFAIVPRLARWLVTQPAADPTGDPGSAIQTELPLRAQIPDMGVTLKGRLDRLDVQRGVVMDFKTSDPKVLKKRLSPDGNELQLQLYAWLLQAEQSAQPVTAARFVSIRREAVTEVDLTPHDGASIAQLGIQALESVRSELKEIADARQCRRGELMRMRKSASTAPCGGVCRRDDYRLDAERSEIEINDSAEQTDGA